ncbi:MAG: hypothetical protein A2144_05450 [Chloroflexi bacterium RBG_16_50_9]|nr:MAG: hypothetical protein A2144_05450 [Chloroflexi bacterium RBG_16_50_9]
MHRFYIAQEIKGNKVVITDAGQFHHIKDVLRLKVNDEVTVFEDKGNEYICLITELGEKKATLTVKAMKAAKTKRNKITIACAIPKKDRMDDIVDNLTQLGVDRIIPMETERVIIRLDDGKGAARLRRWQKIAQSAAEQSQRSSLPVIEPVAHFKNILERSREFDLKLLPVLVGKRRHINEVLGESRPDNILVLIGPEGDFTPEEVVLALKAGFIPVSLGDSVLRVGTAAMAVASYIKLSLAV